MLYACLSNAVFTTFPESTSISIGEDAIFFCAGYGKILLWTVNDVGALFLDGVTYHIKSENGLRRSNLIISGTVDYNKASILCQVVADDVVYNAPLAYLTLIGKSMDLNVMEGNKNYTSTKVVYYTNLLACLMSSISKIFIYFF